jgi:hypothetical protein
MVVRRRGLFRSAMALGIHIAGMQVCQALPQVVVLDGPGLVPHNDADAHQCSYCHVCSCSTYVIAGTPSRQVPTCSLCQVSLLLATSHPHMWSSVRCMVNHTRGTPPVPLMSSHSLKASQHRNVSVPVIQEDSVFDLSGGCKVDNLSMFAPKQLCGS